MIPGQFPVETVTRLRAGTTTDPYSGQPAEDWTTPDELDIDGCLVADGRSSEPLTDARNPVSSDFVVYRDGALLDVRSSDRLRIRGLECKVVGRPFWWNGGGMVINANLSEG